MEMVSCKQCGFQSNVASMFDHHMLSIHNEVVKIEDAIFSTKEEMLDLIHPKAESTNAFDCSDEKVESNVKSKEDEKDLNCPHCDFICESPTVLTRHMKSGCFKFKCPACSFKTSRRLKFIEHEPRKCKMDNNPENPGHAACNKCDYRANTFAQLKIHIKNKNVV